MVGGGCYRLSKSTVSVQLLLRCEVGGERDLGIHHQLLATRQLDYEVRPKRGLGPS
ncbi:hypothetical protein D9M72_623440 [compost metagenome]